jgi:hypothetical protein
MPAYEELKRRVQELAERAWDVPAFEARFRKVATDGIPRKTFDEVGYLLCSEMQENVIFGRNMNPGASQENMEAFARAKGFGKRSQVQGSRFRVRDKGKIEGPKPS